MLRKALTILSLIGLLLSVGLWGVGVFGVGYEEITSGVDTRRKLLRIEDGVMQWTDQRIEYPLEPETDIYIGRRGWRIGTPWIPQWHSRQQFLVPLYIPTLVFAAWPIHVLMGFLSHRRRRRKTGLCVSCGSDLKAPIGSCPECSLAFEQMARKTSAIFSWVGLIAIMAAWGTSYFNGGLWGSNISNDLTLTKGCLVYEHTNLPIGFFERTAWSWAGFRNLETEWLPKYVKRPFSPPNIQHIYTWVIVLPFWIPAAVFAVALWFSHVPLKSRRYRRKLGLCVKCGYDLRGSKEWCPECGNEFETT